MRTSIVTITVDELQDALRKYMELTATSQPDEVLVENAYDKVVLEIPLKPGTVVSGKTFQQRTTSEVSNVVQLPLSYEQWLKANDYPDSSKSSLAYNEYVMYHNRDS